MADGNDDPELQHVSQRRLPPSPTTSTGRFHRHLGVLMRKNALLKKRAPLSTFCELFMAFGSISLLVLARTLSKDAKIPPVPSALHVENAMPVRLPECAEYLEECVVQHIGKANPLCIAGVTFGCASQNEHGLPGVWVRGTCGGMFDIGPGYAPVHCNTGHKKFMKGKKRDCYATRLSSAHGKSVDVNIGSTCSTVQALPNKKCVQVSERLLCDKDAGNAGRRTNFDAPDAEDVFLVTVDQDKLSGISNVCVTRLDTNGCWGMNLTLQCERESKRDIRKLSGASSSQDQHGQNGGSSFGDILGMASKSGMRRYAAGFGVAPKAEGKALRKWLRERRHPLASSIRLFDTAEEIQEHVTSAAYPARSDQSNLTSMLCGAVSFDTPTSSSRVEYTLRFNTSLFANEGQPRLVRLLKAMGSIRTDTLIDPTKGKKPGSFNVLGMTWYTQSGFLAVQRLIDEFVADVEMQINPRNQERRLESRQHAFNKVLEIGDSVVGDDGRPHIIVPFPTDGYTLNVFMMLMPQMLASFLLIALTYSMNRMITAVVSEREKRLRDGMRMMGMHPSAFHVSWFTTYAMIGAIVSGLVTFCLSAGQVLPQSNPAILFIWLFLFSLASTSNAMVVASLFTKAKTAATVGSVVFYTSSYFVLLIKDGSSSRARLLVSLLPASCFQLGAQVFAEQESNGDGIGMHNVFKSYGYYGSVFECCAMLLFDTIFMYIVFIYLDQIMPREVGLQRPWYFPLLPSTWREICGKDSSGDATNTAEEYQAEQLDCAKRSEQTALIEQDLGVAAAALARKGETVELCASPKSMAVASVLWIPWIS
jgi:hypothetical protein